MISRVLLLSTVLIALAVVLPQRQSAAEELPYRVVDGQVDDATYTGWRVFHSSCHFCHGIGAVGTSRAPALLEKVSVLSANQFAIAVLYRYPIIVGFDEARGDDLSALREAFAADIRRHEHGGLMMPSWHADDGTRPHVLDLYAYLRARADGVLERGEPTRLQD